VLKSILVMSAVVACAARTPRALQLYRSSQGDHVIVLDRIGGKTVPLIVDTGAPAHLFSGALAWYLGLAQTRSNAQAYDSTSAIVPMNRIEGSGSPLLGTSPLWSVFAPQLDAISIAGLFSPQALLSPDHSIVIDLAAGTLELGRSHDRKRPSEFVATPCTSAIGSVYLVDARIGGRAARLVVDTGAPRTTVYATSDSGRALRAANSDAVVQSELDHLVGDRRGDRLVQLRAGFAGVARVERVLQQRVVVGSATITLDVDVSNSSDSSCKSDGVLGLDFLAGWTLELDPRRLVGRRGLATKLPRLELAPLPPIELTDTALKGACSGAPPLEATPSRHQCLGSSCDSVDPLVTWRLASERMHVAGAAQARACERAGYLRATINLDFETARDRRSFRRVISVRPGRRYRNGQISVRSQDGSPVPELSLERLRPEAWHDPSQITDQANELRRVLAPLGLRVLGTSVTTFDDSARVDVEFQLGR
jgi:hypothetical protein